jgi:hypothetical protein
MIPGNKGLGREVDNSPLLTSRLRISETMYLVLYVPS